MACGLRLGIKISRATLTWPTATGDACRDADLCHIVSDWSPVLGVGQAGVVVDRVVDALGQADPELAPGRFVAPLVVIACGRDTDLEHIGRLQRGTLPRFPAPGPARRHAPVGAFEIAMHPVPVVRARWPGKRHLKIYNA